MNGTALGQIGTERQVIGIILCSQKDESIVPYSELNDAKQIVSSQIRLTLPSAEELQHEMEEESRAGKAGLPGIQNGSDFAAKYIWETIRRDYVQRQGH